MNTSDSKEHQEKRSTTSPHICNAANKRIRGVLLSLQLCVDHFTFPDSDIVN
uniref:Uncharacterized protein n=1 Tax=Octopus bimaculoides TaxID=37653 RepID=A0A0L8GDB9_OCTBM